MTLANSTLLMPFLLVATLQAKHVICDGPLQTLRMVRDKSHYLWPMGLLHSAIHAVASFIVLKVFGFDPAVAAMACVAEFFLHYHIDYAKENTVKLLALTPASGPFWWLLTLDQALHHFTYLALGLLLPRM